MTINLIAAVGLHGEIGFKGRIPWIGLPHIVQPDLGWFEQQTIGGILIVGHNTYQEMLAMGFESKSRDVVVWSRRDKTTPMQLLIDLEDTGRDIWICGGEQCYAAFMNLVQRFYISRIPWTGFADKWMPPLPFGKPR